MKKEKFFRLVRSSWRMRLFLLWKLPAAWFMGISVRACDASQAVVRLPYGWRSQNPFRSTYFAAQCAAAELSTGLLALAALQEQAPVSMLVVKIEAEFFKKASATLLFTCDDGAAIQAAIARTLADGEAQLFRAESVGRLPDGSEAARMYITWSFKRKR